MGNNFCYVGISHAIFIELSTKKKILIYFLSQELKTFLVECLKKVTVESFLGLMSGLQPLERELSKF